MPVLYKFHHASIHEERAVVFLARCVPMAIFIGTILGSTISLLFYPTAFLVLSALFNVLMWLNVVSKAIFCITGISEVARQLEEHQEEEDEAKTKHIADDLENSRSSPMAEPFAKRVRPGSIGQSDSDISGVSHMIVLTNYKEDEHMMAQTLQSLAEAKTCKTFHVVLACEERETGIKEKAGRLQKKFMSEFAQVVVTLHPFGLIQGHLDGSQDTEVPGKASNLRWAVFKGFEECSKKIKLDPGNVVVTVSDADCLFHPNYFRHVAREYAAMQIAPGSKHLWTMWQPPQLAHRNYYDCPTCSRSWAVIASIFEFGGTCSLASGGHHMTFSAYSLSMQLALNAQPWDGDVIAEDHHCFLKCWFYSVYSSASDLLEGRRAQSVCRPKLNVRCVFLPVKSLSVITDDYWDCWRQRFQQAKRHAQGIAEFPYAMLASFDALTSVPFGLHSLSLMVGLSRVNAHMIFLHMLPILQSVTLGQLTLFWIWNNRSMPLCPDRVWLEPRHEFFLCGLAGAWALVWPVVLPMVMVWLANMLFMRYAFVGPASSRHTSIWHGEDGNVPKDGTRYFQLCRMIATDCGNLSPLMFLYGFIPAVMAYRHIIKNGNRFNYVVAAKGARAQELEMTPICRSNSDAHAI